MGCTHWSRENADVQNQQTGPRSGLLRAKLCHANKGRSHRLAGHDENPNVFAPGAMALDRNDLHALANEGRLQFFRVKTQHVGCFANSAHQGQCEAGHQRVHLRDAGRLGNQQSARLQGLHGSGQRAVQIGHQMQTDDSVRIRKSETTFNLVQPPNRNYFDVLRNKLKWGR